MQPRDLKTKSALQLLNEERASTPITTFVKELDNLLGGGVALGQLTGARHTAQQYWGLATRQYRAACSTAAQGKGGAWGRRVHQEAAADGTGLHVAHAAPPRAAPAAPCPGLRACI